MFGDHPLAREVQGYERRYAKEEYAEVLGQIADAIRRRYDLTDAPDLPSIPDSGTTVA
ncbi:hypothetical protein D3C83_157450 [compost metagenome]